MADQDRLIELKAAAEEVEKIAASKVPETFFHTKWCREHIQAWDKLQKIIDGSSRIDDIVMLRQCLEDVRVCTFGPDAPKPAPYCKVHGPLWSLIQAACTSALRADDEMVTSN